MFVLFNNQQMNKAARFNPCAAGSFYKTVDISKSMGHCFKHGSWIFLLIIKNYGNTSMFISPMGARMNTVNKHEGKRESVRSRRFFYDKIYGRKEFP